jgi:Zn-dependent peptidase ImmA (M78 family)
VPVSRKRVEAAAAEVLRAAGVRKPPVPVEAIVLRYGLQVRYQPLQSDLSGFLYRGTDQTVVGVNSTHATVRQRFTIAHELGHYLLHRSHRLRIDRAVLTRSQGDHLRGKGDRDEVEANRFAAAVLLPDELLRHDVEARQPLDVLHDEGAVRALARRYRVSTQALVLRLRELGYVDLGYAEGYLERESTIHRP